VLLSLSCSLSHHPWTPLGIQEGDSEHDTLNQAYSTIKNQKKMVIPSFSSIALQSIYAIPKSDQTYHKIESNKERSML
jgi:hypothetical protein